MDRPTYTTSGSNLKVNIPPGWYSSIVGISRKSYQQLVGITYSLFPQSRDLLKSKQGDKYGPKPVEKKMTEFRQGIDTLATIAQDDPSTINLDFYYSAAKVPSRDIPSLMNDNFRSNSLQFAEFSKPQSAPKNMPDYQIFMVFVEDTPMNSGQGKPYDDAVITIHCTKADPDDPTPVIPSSKYPLHDIQGEVVPGLTKAFEYFYFFTITDLSHFRQIVGKWVLSRITTAQQIAFSKVQPSGLPVPGEPFVGLSLGFTSIGLKLFGLNQNLQDEAFDKGQRRDAKDLGDIGTESSGVFHPAWDAEFQNDIHGIFQITAHDDGNANVFLSELEDAFRKDPSTSSIRKILNFRSTFRAQPNTLKEHFGFRDGISRPEIDGVTFYPGRPMKFLGAPVVDIGLVVMGLDGDQDKATRPPWAVGGSFLVLRKLKQLVPEYHDFALKEGRRLFPNLAPEKAKDQLGARLFGRWPSGTPLVLSPDEDDPEIASDDSKLNSFDYDPKDQKTCPFSAHTRKSYARNDIPDSKSHLFRRASIPYGPELTPEEIQRGATTVDRGIIFTCYQSSIERGFKFIQKSSINNPNFPPGKPIRPGHDPILGATGKENFDVQRYTTGANPLSPAAPLSFPIQFVRSDGGEYFFLPSISTLRSRIAA